MRLTSGFALDLASVEMVGIDKARRRAGKLLMERLKAALAEQG